MVGQNACTQLRDFICQGRIDEVMALLSPLDTSVLEEALEKGRGAILAYALLGPYLVNRFILGRLNRDIIDLEALQGTVLEAHLGPPIERIKTLDVSKEEVEKRTLATCLVHLRRNGVVVVAADGRWGHGFRQYSFLNHAITLSPGTAQLARMARAPTLWLFTLWGTERKRKKVIIEKPGLDPVLATENWEDIWIDAYLRRSAEVMAHQPENLGFVGGLWNAPRGGFSSLSRLVPKGRQPLAAECVMNDKLDGRLHEVLQRYVTDPAEWQAILAGGPLLKATGLDSFSVVNLVLELKPISNVSFDPDTLERTLKDIHTLRAFLEA
jgi:hypothetical protein